MARCTRRVWIRCEPAALFEVLMDASANRHWQSGVVETRAAPTGEAVIGTTMTEIRALLGYRTTLVYRLVELDRPWRAVVELLEGRLRGTAGYACRPVASGTELTVISDVTPRRQWRCVGTAVAALLTSELALSCERLKLLVEQSPPARLHSSGTPAGLSRGSQDAVLMTAGHRLANH